MKKNNFLPLTLVILLLALPLFGQTEDALLHQLAQNEHESVPRGVTLEQNGFNNEARIRQVDAAASSLMSLQSGNENAIRVMQRGNFIDISLSQQGDGNVYNANLRGRDAQIDVSQNGDENYIFQSLFVNDADLRITQEGNQNELIQTGWQVSKGIEILQQGSGMKIIIDSN